MTKLRTGLTLAFLSLVPFVAIAQTSAASESDPANLKGERIRPINGLELPVDQGATGLWESLLKLRTRASLMLIVAHPDDEDSGMLAYEVRGQGVHAAMLTLTRGEGGQNLMTGDFNVALGLIRTQELLAEDRYSGADQLFGTEIDFGFSKTKEETLAQWGYDRVLYDSVRAVRLYRPLIVTAVFVGGVTDGHGHHQVSGQMAQEVFDAAGDPKVFPEMGLEPWSPLKVYARAPRSQVSDKGLFDYATGKFTPVRFYNYITKTWTTAIPSTDVVIHEGDVSDKLGMSYSQFARTGLALQKTQNGGATRTGPGGPADSPYTRYASRVPAAPAAGSEKSFFDGIDISLPGIASLAPGKTLPAGSLQHIAQLVDQAVSGYSAQDPAKIAPLLAEGLKSTRTLIAAVSASHNLTPRESTDILHELRVKESQFELALAQSLDVSVHAEATVAPALEGHPYNLNLTLKNNGPSELQVKELALQPEGQPLRPIAIDAPLAHGGTLARPVTVPAQSAASSRPYFTRKNEEQAFYDVSNPALRLAPATPPAQTAWATVDFDGVPFSVASVVTAPQSTSPLWVLPAVSVTMTPSAGILTPGEKSVPVATRIDQAAGNNFSGQIHVELPKGWQSDPATSAFTVSVTDPDSQQSFRLTPPATATTARLTAQAKIGAESFTESFRKVGYPGVADTYYFSPATYRTRAVDVHVAPGLRVAYLPGTGDEVQALLENIGVHATTITAADIAAGKLADFNTLIIGPRAYTSDKALAPANKLVLDFAKNGGTVVVQYQAHAFRPADAPFPITLESQSGDGDRVVEELAKVTLSASSTGVLDSPNKITAADFDGWIEERGHGFPATWGAEYEAPTETHDADQDPQHGGLLVARYGKGYYVYDAFALYRQLPEAVPGAYRLFANMLSLGHQPN